MVKTRTQGSRAQLSTLASGVAASLAALALTILVFEAWARVFGFGQIAEFVPDPRWGYLMRPSQTVWSYGLPVYVNALGLRGPEVERAKPPGRFRVVFVGDSITHGGGRIREEELFCRRFETDARALGRDLDVVNLSAPGWSPQNWRAYVECNGLLEADAVVVVVPEVDLSRPFSTMAYHDFREKGPSFRLAGFLARFVLMVHPPLRGAHDVPATVRANVSALEFARRATGARPFLAVFLPSPAGRAEPSAWAAFEAALPDALDLRPQLSAAHFQDGLHLNGEGHRLVAGHLRERMGAVLSVRHPRVMTDAR